MNKLKLLGVLCALLLSAVPAPAQQTRIKTLQNNGSPAQKFDIVFLGDGFTASDQSKYDAKVASCLNILWSVSPFRELRGHFNVHVVYVDSAAGSGYDSSGKRKMDYPFGSEYATNGSDMVILKNQARALEVARTAPGADAVIVITTLPGRSHAGNMILMADNQASLPHELGHLVGRLGDEYSSRSKLLDREHHPLPGGELPYPNLQAGSSIDSSSRESLRKTAKWGHFIDLPDSDPIVSAYQGGYYREVGVWRPSYSCVMRSSTGAIFCPVCHEELYKAILRKSGGVFNDKSYHSQFPLKLWSTKVY